MLEKRDNRTDLEILLEVFKRNKVKYEPVIPKYEAKVIDYLELVKDDGTVIRFYVNPDELLSDYSYYFGNKNTF